jgi:arylsulfatase
MSNVTERTWTMVPVGQAIEKLMKSYVQYPPRKLQSIGYNGPIELSKYQQFQWLRDSLDKEGVNLSMPTGN